MSNLSESPNLRVNGSPSYASSSSTTSNSLPTNNLKRMSSNASAIPLNGAQNHIVGGPPAHTSSSNSLLSGSNPGSMSTQSISPPSKLRYSSSGPAPNLFSFNQQIDVSPNYHLYSMNKILSIKTGAYDQLSSSNAQTNINKDFHPLDTQSDISTISSRLSVNLTIPSPIVSSQNDEVFSKLDSNSQNNTGQGQIGLGNLSTAPGSTSPNLGHDYTDSVDISNFDDPIEDRSPTRTTKDLKQTGQRIKTTPILNYDDYNTPTDSEDSDNARSPNNRKRKKQASSIDVVDESSDDDFVIINKSPRTDGKSSKKKSQRVTIKKVCNASITGGFHMIALYLSNNILVLTFEARSSITFSEDHYGGAILDSTEEEGSTWFFSNYGNDYMKSMGRYSDGEDDNDSLASSSTTRDYNEMDQYKKLLRQYQNISQSHWSSEDSIHGQGRGGNTADNHLTMPAPIIRTITYFRDNNIPIDDMIMDEKFLICIDRNSVEGDIYILPLCKIIFPYVEENVWPFKVQRQTPSNNIFEGDTISSHTDELSHTESIQGDDIYPETNSDDIPSLLNFTQLISESSKSQENLLATIRSITKISSKKRKFNIKKFGYITCSRIWKTFFNKYYIILGTSLGYLIFLNLHSQIEECTVLISNNNHRGIQSMEIVNDNREQYKYLAITCVNNSYSRPSSNNILSSFTSSNSTSTKSRAKWFFKQVLEQKDPQLHTCKNICEYKRYSKMPISDGSTAPMNSRVDDMIFTPCPLMEAEEFKMDSDVSSRKKLDSFSLSIYEDPVKGPMLCFFNSLDNRLSLYDPLSTKFPLFTFQLNSDTHSVFVTDSLLITAQRSSQLRSTPQPQHIWVISRLLANALQSSNSSSQSQVISPPWTQGQHQSKKSSSVFQDFQLPTRQKILGILPGYHLKDIAYQSHDISYFLEGCFVWTQNSIYELKQKYSPDFIFQQLLRHPSGLFGEKSDQFGKTFKLDIFKIYEQEGDRAFRKLDFERAFSLYDFSFISEKKRVEKLMHSHQIDDVIQYICGLLKNPQSFPLNKRRELSDLLFFAYLYKLLETSEVCVSEETIDERLQKREANSLFKGENRQLNKSKKHEGSLFFDRGIGSQCELPVDTSLWKDFRMFLLESHDYNPKSAMENLVDNGMIAVALEVANHSNIIPKTLKYLQQKNIMTLSDECLDFLFRHLYAADVVCTGSGIFLHSSSPSVQIKFYLEHIKRSRELLESTVKKQDSATGVKIYTREEISQYSDSTNALDMERQFFNLIHYVNDEMILLEIAQTFNPEKTLFVSQDDYGFPQTTEQSPEAIQRQYEYRDSLYYFPSFTLQSHIEIFLIAMIHLVSIKQPEDDSIQLNQKKVSNSSIGTFSHAYLYRHTQEKLEEIMQKCTHLYRVQFILSICLMYQNIDALCKVYEENEMWQEALSARLSQIRSKKQKIGEEQTIQKVLNLLERFLILPRIQKSSSRIATKAQLILKIFKFWKENLSSTKDDLVPLEKLCVDRLEDIGLSLVHILLQKESLSKPYASLCQEYPLVLPFSHNFMLQVTRSHINSMSKSMHEKQSAISNLQSQILRNMEKDLLEKEQKYIIVPTQVLRQKDEWFIFTCNHMYPKEEFGMIYMNQFYMRVKNLLSIISQSKESIGDVQSIFLSVHFIDQEYHAHIRCGSGICRQACPVCIYNYLCGRLSRKYSSLFKEDSSLLWRMPNISSLGS